MYAFTIHPLRPVGWVARQHRRRQDAVPSSILHVDVQVLASHTDYYVEIDLHGARYALLDGERVGLLAAPPAGEL